MSREQEVVDLLSLARFGRHRIAGIPEELKPDDLAGAYEMQRQLAEQWARVTGGGFAGFKIACTSEIPQRQLGISSPFYGRLLAGTVHESPAKLDGAPFFMRVIEPEFGFRLASDLGPGDDVESAIDVIVPAIEIVDSRYNDWEAVGAHSLIIDNACHGAWVKGKESQSFDDLASHRVRLVANGSEVSNGTGAAVLGHPFHALRWLAETLPKYGLGLKAGDWVTTGVATGLFYAKPGDHIVADFGSLGGVEIQF